MPKVQVRSTTFALCSTKHINAHFKQGKVQKKSSVPFHLIQQSTRIQTLNSRRPCPLKPTQIVNTIGLLLNKHSLLSGMTHFGEIGPGMMLSLGVFTLNVITDKDNVANIRKEANRKSCAQRRCAPETLRQWAVAGVLFSRGTPILPVPDLRW